MTSDNSLSLQELIHQLQAGIVEPGMVVMVHSSLRSIGHVEGGAGTVVQALVDVVGKKGTVLFPGLIFNGSVTEFLRTNPVIDLRQCPVTTGAIPRAAAAHPLARRSIHPSHSVVGIGPAAESLFAGDQNGQGPCGTESPFYKAAMINGYILLMGVTNTRNTTLHCVEELAAPYMNSDGVCDVEVVDYQGLSRPFAVRGYPINLPRRFDAINPYLLERNIMTEHQLGQAKVMRIDARRMIACALDLLEENPYLLGGTPA